jgi:hypothetical protein
MTYSVHEAAGLCSAGRALLPSGSSSRKLGQIGCNVPRVPALGNHGAIGLGIEHLPSFEELSHPARGIVAPQ